MTLGVLGCPEGCHLGEWQAFRVAQRFFTTDLFASSQSLRHQKEVLKELAPKAKDFTNQRAHRNKPLSEQDK